MNDIGTSSPPIVSTAKGELQGARLKADGKPLFVYKGIPFAAPPVGPLRWRPPQPAAPWAGVRDALEFGPDFPQAPNARSRAPSQSEDCLYLNVWAPADASLGSLPVMAWFNGGGFERGSGSDAANDGAHMAAQGVIVVSFNYRAGIFGFLAHPGLSRESAQGVSGNYGLLDQIAALQWVRDNISDFGGDPERITAFGVSAGSASIALLLVSPLGKGLFQQAILHSPGAARPLASLEAAEKAALALGSDIEALRGLSADELLTKMPLLSPKVRGLTTPRVLRPIRDGWLLPEDERPVLKSGRQHAVPLIVGSNADEGSLLTKAWPVDNLEQYRNMTLVNFGEAAAEAGHVYPAKADDQAHPRVAEMFADTQFNYGTRLLAESMTRKGVPTWRYLFLRRRPDQRDGPHHGEEVGHVFGTYRELSPGQPASFDGVDEKISANMMKVWVTFASNGNPNFPGLPYWAPYDAAAENHMTFGDIIEEGRGWRKEELNFLDRFYDTKQ
jgi:para-nitrobenzyl esterase